MQESVVRTCSRAGMAAVLTWSIFCLQAAARSAVRPFFYAAFDGTAAAISKGGRIRLADSATGPFSFVPGVCGGAVRILATDCRYQTNGRFPAAAGTLAFWIRPQWDGKDPRGRYLFTLYGAPHLPDAYRRNRWSIGTRGGMLTWTIHGRDGRVAVTLTADISGWRAGSWHHVAATWSGINSDGNAAESALYLDGEPSGRRTGLRIAVGPVNTWFALGSDSDGSPDYAEADFDEVYIYSRALSATEIARGVRTVRARQDRPSRSAESATSGRFRKGWWNDAWPFRCRVRIPADAGDGQLAMLPFDVQADLDALDVAAVADPASVRVIPCAPRTGNPLEGAVPLPSRVDQNTVVWKRPPGTERTVQLYFGIAEIDFGIPLAARVLWRKWPLPPPALEVRTPDYAAETYGDAWDFDEGDFEGIDQWGNTPECLRNRRVHDGVLEFDVHSDPWFIWGDMWGQTKPGRPVRIDLERYPILTMRIRQSCASATWELYGRPAGSPSDTRLLHYQFPVHGTGWQIVRVDLRRDARWGGVLSAFRIDPTSRIDSAHVWIDWIRLSPRIPQAEREAVEILPPLTDAEIASVTVALPERRVLPRTEQIATVTVRGANGAPGVRVPVTVRLTNTANATFRTDDFSGLTVGPHAVRLLTDPQGRARIAVEHSSEAGPNVDKIQALADGTGKASPVVSVDIQTGPPRRYRVEPSRAQMLPADRLPLDVTVQLTDAWGNPVAEQGRRLRLSVPAGATIRPDRVETDRTGTARARFDIALDSCWVARVHAEDPDGLTGDSGPIAVFNPTLRQNPVRLLPNGYFAFRDGRVFVPLGGFYANWVHTPSPDGEWQRLLSFTDADDAQKQRWFRFLADNGVTALRFFLRTHRKNGMEPMDIGGRVNRDLFAAALHLMDLGRKERLMFLPVLHEDYTKPVYWNRKHLERFALPRFAGENLDALPPCRRRFIRDRRLLEWIQEKYTDPDAIACQDMYTREIVSALRGNPWVFAYELENEMVNAPASWVNHQVDVIRSVDPQTLICVSHGGGGLFTADPLWWFRNTKIDFYTYHLYPHGAVTAPEIDYGLAVDVLTRYGRMCGPCFIGESAGDQFRLHPRVETRRRTMRDIIWLALTSGNPGVFFWNARGSEVREFGPARKALARLDLASFRRLRPEIGIDVRHPLDDDKFFRTPKGRAAYAIMARYARHFLRQGVDFDFTVRPGQYPKRAGLDRFAPPTPSVRPFRVSPGWELKYLADADWKQALVYIRNVSGVEHWEVETRHRFSQYLRTWRAAPLRLQWSLPPGLRRMMIVDLDAGKETDKEIRAEGTLDLGVTDHDYAVILRRIR